MTSQSFVVAVGEEFEVRLRGNPSAGYTWTPGPLPDGLELSASEVVPPGPDCLPGDSGTQVFRIRSHTAGETSLDFLLKRPWESEVVGRHRITVRTG